MNIVYTYYILFSRTFALIHHHEENLATTSALSCIANLVLFGWCFCFVGAHESENLKDDPLIFDDVKSEID